MAVSELNAPASTGATSNSDGGSFTVSAGTSDRFMLYMVGGQGNSGQGVTAVDFGGQAMTLVVEEAGFDTAGFFAPYVSIWRLDETGLAAATDGDFDLTSTLSSGSVEAFAVVYEGVDDSDPIVDSDGASAFAGSSTTNSNIDITLTTVDGGAVASLYSSDLPSGETVDVSVASPLAVAVELETSAGGVGYTVSTDTPNSGTSVTVDLTHDTASHSNFRANAHVAVALRPANDTTVDGDITGFLPTVSGQIDVINSVDGDITGFLATVSAFVEHNVFVDGAITGFLPSVDGAIDVINAVDGSIAGFLPSVSGFVQHSVFMDGDITGFLPTVSGTVQGGNAVSGDITGFLPTVSAFIEHNVFVDGGVTGFLPQVSAFVEVGALVDGNITGFLPQVSGVVTLPIPVDGDIQGFLPTISAFVEVPAVVDGAIVGYLAQVNSFINSGQDDPIGGSAGSRGVRQGDQNIDSMLRTEVSEAQDEEDILDLLTAIVPALSQRKI